MTAGLSGQDGEWHQDEATRLSLRLSTNHDEVSLGVGSTKPGTWLTLEASDDLLWWSTVQRWYSWGEPREFGLFRLPHQGSATPGTNASPWPEDRLRLSVQLQWWTNGTVAVAWPSQGGDGFGRIWFTGLVVPTNGPLLFVTRHDTNYTATLFGYQNWTEPGAPRPPELPSAEDLAVAALLQANVPGWLQDYCTTLQDRVGEPPPAPDPAGPHRFWRVREEHPDSNGDGLADSIAFARGLSPFAWDTDGDGMPDAWELHYGLNPRDAADAAGDNNQDGVSNLDEYAYGNDPNAEQRRGPGESAPADVVVNLWAGSDLTLEGRGISAGDHAKGFPQYTTPTNGVPRLFLKEEGEAETSRTDIYTVTMHCEYVWEGPPRSATPPPSGPDVVSSNNATRVTTEKFQAACDPKTGQETSTYHYTFNITENGEASWSDDHTGNGRGLPVIWPAGSVHAVTSAVTTTGWKEVMSVGTSTVAVVTQFVSGVGGDVPSVLYKVETTVTDFRQDWRAFARRTLDTEDRPTSVDSRVRELMATLNPAAVTVSWNWYEHAAYSPTGGVARTSYSRYPAAWRVRTNAQGWYESGDGLGEYRIHARLPARGSGDTNPVTYRLHWYEYNEPAAGEPPKVEAREWMQTVSHTETSLVTAVQPLPVPIRPGTTWPELGWIQFAGNTSQGFDDYDLIYGKGDRCAWLFVPLGLTNTCWLQLAHTTYAWTNLELVSQSPGIATLEGATVTNVTSGVSVVGASAGETEIAVRWKPTGAILTRLKVLVGAPKPVTLAVHVVEEENDDVRLEPSVNGEDVIAIGAGPNGFVDTPRLGDDKLFANGIAFGPNHYLDSVPRTANLVPASFSPTELAQLGSNLNNIYRYQGNVQFDVVGSDRIVVNYDLDRDGKLGEPEQGAVFASAMLSMANRHLYLVNAIAPVHANDPDKILGRAGGIPSVHCSLAMGPPALWNDSFLTAAHELGHCFGLRHPNDGTDSNTDYDLQKPGRVPDALMNPKEGQSSGSRLFHRHWLVLKALAF